jgi:hypothetical protein
MTRRCFLLLLGAVILLSLGLGGPSTHLPWNSAGYHSGMTMDDMTSLNLEHGDHLDDFTHRRQSLPVITRLSTSRILLQACLFGLLPPLSPLLPPPRLTTA